MTVIPLLSSLVCGHVPRYRPVTGHHDGIHVSANPPPDANTPASAS